MKLLVTGRHGQLARSLAERSVGRDDLELIFVGRPDVDLESPGALAEAIRAARPDVVINAAAYTDVDRAEEEPEHAFRINAEAAGEAAAAAAAVNADIIQISTDYVFNGRTSTPWREDDATGPLNVYGASKLAGEERVRAANSRHLILRSSWLVGPFGRNFVRTMLRLAADRAEIRVVADQRGCPTGTLMLADAILAVVDQAGTSLFGRTYHVAGKGECSWAELASEVMRASAAAGGPDARIIPITTSEYPTKARRPAYSALDSSAFERDISFAVEPWQPMVARLIGRLLREMGRLK